MSEESVQKTMSVPMAIIVAGALVGGAVYFSSTKSPGSLTAKTGNVPVQSQPQGPTPEMLSKVTRITKEDHILGDPNAPVTIVEFSDTECPFCKIFQPTMNKIIDEYGKAGKVAWVYRHFPLDQLHSKARKEAEATECANELGGNDAFWAYLNGIFAITPSNNGLDSAELPKIAKSIGLDVQKFEACLSSGKYAQHVSDNQAEALATGAQGTPWSIIIGPSGKKYPLSGAQPYENVKALIETALKDK